MSLIAAGQPLKRRNPTREIPCWHFCETVEILHEADFQLGFSIDWQMNHSNFGIVAESDN